MITSISIHNIALITHLDAEFGAGLTILSGETGAGKSIIVDGLNFVLGKRADKNLIRYGENSASVTACFREEGSVRLAEKLKEQEIPAEEEVILRRTMTLDGRNACFVNGTRVTLAVLREISAELADVYGQHESVGILNPANHIALLDAYGGAAIADKLTEVRRASDTYREICAAIAKYGSDKDIDRNLDLIRYQLEEIESAELVAGEEEELIKKRRKMNEAQRIVSALYEAYALIGGDEEGNVLERLSAAMARLRKIEDAEEEAAGLAERLESAKIELDDAAETLRALAEENEFDEREYERCELRIAQIRKLKKYGADETEILAYAEELRGRYDFYLQGEAALEKLDKQRTDAYETCYRLCAELGALRRAAARTLEEKLQKELAELGMKSCRFAVQFNEFPDAEAARTLTAAQGLDEATFLFSANAGQPPRDLSKIISGGELSRFMLAVKNILSECDGIGCMIFDEIDTGISGATAQVVAEKLYEIGLKRQVLAITHLPQLASMADRHYLIEKYEADGKTGTTLTLLDEERQIAEIARLNGGRETSAYSLPHARELKRAAAEKQTELRKKIG